MKILGEKYTKNELIFCIYAMAANRCREALGLENIDAVISDDTWDEQKMDFYAMLATYLGSMHNAVAKARKKNNVDQIIDGYSMMAQTGKEILDMAVKAKEAADAGKSH
jgi:hypothetical protein